MGHKQVRAQYTQEFKVEAVRQVRAGQAIELAYVGDVRGFTGDRLGARCSDVSFSLTQATEAHGVFNKRHGSVRISVCEAVSEIIC